MDVHSNNLSIKKVIVFDLDGTLTKSKTLLDQKMSEALEFLLKKHRVAVVSGGSFPQFKKQFLPALNFANNLLENLYIFPSNGSYLYSYDGNDWVQRYAEELTIGEKNKIKDALVDVLSKLGFSLKSDYGEQIEDRGGQITFSALGQAAPLDLKTAWDPDFNKRKSIVSALEKYLPEFEISMGGKTSVDITRKGVDKNYAIKKIEKHLNVSSEDILYVGDAIFPGGNDYSAIKEGEDYVKVDDTDDTLKVINMLK